MTNQPFFTRDRDAFIPTKVANGPWDPNAGNQGLGYINSDVTLYLHRLPVQEWIGFEVVNHRATDGIAIGECFLYDQEGPIGSSTVAALAQRKPMPPLTPPR
jgi:hypothetical protein